MGFWLLVFFLTPIIEMYLLIEVGGYIGALPTIALVMLTAVVGVALLKIQGLATLTRGMSRLQSGELPAREMAEGILLAVAGALLLTPGFVTDTVGFVLLFPPSRAAVARKMLERVVVVGPGAGPGGGAFGAGQANPHGRFRGGYRNRDDIIEGEFESRTDPDEQIGDFDDPDRRRDGHDRPPR